MAKIPTTSTTLLRDLAQDSQHARWGEFVACYRPMMEAFMRERFPTLDADDVIQETLIELIRVFPIYHYSPKEKGHFHNYLTGILRHRALRMMGEEKRRANLVEMVGSRIPRDRGKMVGSRVPRDRGTQEILQLPHTTMAPTTGTPNENPSWQALCRNFTTNIVTHQTEMRRPDAAKRLSPAEFALQANEPQYRPVLVSKTETNKIEATMVNLGGRTIVFNEPIPLDAGREYWIVGPGILDAQFSVASTATVRIANCIFRNRTKTSPVNAGIDYVLEGGAYLNFTDLPSTEALKLEVGTRVRSNGMSEGRRWWRIKGPDDIVELPDDNLSHLTM